MSLLLPFASSSDLTLQYDTRRCQDLASDTGTPITAAALSTNPVILYVLNRATEIVLMHARLGKRYTEDELQNLALDPDHLGKGYELRGLVCDIAYGLLVMRRGTGQSDQTRLSPNFIAAQNTLMLLARGELIFSRTESEGQADAGTPRTGDLTLTAAYYLPRWSRDASRGLLPDSPLTREPYGC